MVNTLAMDVGHLSTGQLGQLLDAADADDLFQVITHPQRDGRPPVPIARDAPIIGILEPIAKALVLDVVRHPVRLVV